MTQRVLLTGIGGDIAQNVAVILKEFDRKIHIVGTDIHDRHGGNYFADDVEVIPKASSPDYPVVLEEVIEKHSINYVFPLTEPELGVLGTLVDMNRKLTWITPGKRCIELGLDKYLTAQKLSEMGIPTPWTILVSEGLPLKYPCILKGRLGSGSRNIFLIQNRSEAEFFGNLYPDSVFQEFLEPEENEVTCAVFRRKTGEVYVLQMLRKLVGGLTGWARVIDEKEISEMCTKVAESCELLGSMNIQLRVTAAGPRIFEINPRISSTSLMRHRAGFRDVCWSLLDVNDKPFSYTTVPVGTILIRKTDALVMEPGE